MSQIRISEIERIFCGREPGVVGKHKLYGVLVPIVEKEGELHLLYEVRDSNMSRQPGEVCFPGGQLEPGESMEHCAIRETMEELGIPQEGIRVLTRLDTLHAHPDISLYCYLGVLDYALLSESIANPDEVAETFLVPLSFLIENPPEIHMIKIKPLIDDNFPYDKINSPEGYQWRMGQYEVPIYSFEGHAIWGMTARITRNIIDTIKEEIK
jgi:peroxisomal coenzyme A diphosphatase NUDT7